MSNTSFWQKMCRAVVLCGMLSGSTLIAAPLGTGTLRDASTFAPERLNPVTSSVTNANVIPHAQVRDGVNNSVALTADFPGDNLLSTVSFKPKHKTPGFARKISLKAAANQPDSSWTINFRDRNGKNSDGKNSYSIPLTFKQANEWQDVELVIPENWPKDLYLSDISVNNKGAESSKTSTTLYIYDLKLTVDLDSIKKKDQDVLTYIEFFETNGDRLYRSGDTVKYRFNLMNWLDTRVTGKLNITVLDPTGKVAFDQNYDVNAASTFSTDVILEPTIYGSYRIDYTFEGSPRKLAGHRRFAVIPDKNQITREQQLKSPWGLNIHGAQEDAPMWLFSDLGVTWVRDYAYTYTWVNGAKDSEGKYTSWPWYDKLDQRYKEANLMVLACFMRALQVGISDSKLNEPNDEWFKVFADFAKEYPNIEAWELDNEYDLRNATHVGGAQWEAYTNFHRNWAERMKKLPITGLIAEQGKAGLGPDLVRTAVLNGSFKDLDVINSHFYCGVQPPELSSHNVNAHGDFKAQSEKTYVYDSLRALVAAGSADGKKRQTWITEFGWDTKAVHIVTEEEQAAYLQRGYLLGLNSGLDKMFWFFHFDSAEEFPSTFFGGCGLYDWHKDPKPAAAAFAFMAKTLVNPQIVGSFNPGDNAMGYIIADRGRLLSVVFKLDKSKSGCEIVLNDGKSYDMFGNALSAGPRILDITPIWTEDISQNNPYLKQTPFTLESDGYTVSCAGDSVVLKFSYAPNAYTPKTQSLSYKLQLPEAWGKEVAGDVELTAEEQLNGKVIPIEFSIPINTPEADYPVQIVITDKTNNATKSIDLILFARTPATITAESFGGVAGKPAKVALKVRNNSKSTRTLILKPVLPADWAVTPATISLKDVPGETIAEAAFDITWAPIHSNKDAAKIEVYNDKLQKLCESVLTPPAITLKKQDVITLDGNLSDWPAECRIPREFIGSTQANQVQDVYLAYNDKGIYYAIKTDDSKAVHVTPTWFWAQDAVEFFIDPLNDKTEGRGYNAGDRHFWTVPMVSTGKVYLGRWGHVTDDAGQENIPNQGVSRVAGNGYIMEGFIPAEQLNGVKLEPGVLIGFNLNGRVVKKNNDAYEFFWSSSKRAKVQEKPATWGTLVLE